MKLCQIQAAYDNAAWPNGEWMEIYNSGSSPVNVPKLETGKQGEQNFEF